MWDIKTKDEIKELWSILKARNGQLNERAVHQFAKGDRVRFKGRYSMILEGTVKKVNKKTVSVDADNGEGWRVHPTSLTKI